MLQSYFIVVNYITNFANIKPYISGTNMHAHDVFFLLKHC
jgi:hypothetical protein